MVLSQTPDCTRLEWNKHAKEKTFETLGEKLFWAYANVGLAHVALQNNHSEYQQIDYMVRARLYKGLCGGTMKIGTLYDDEKEKLNNNTCCYCGATGELSLDHLIPRKSGGTDSGDNIIYACKKCNSSKKATDLIEWMFSNDKFPPILILRRYLKIVIAYCEECDYMNKKFAGFDKLALPFRIDLLPYKFPKPCDLQLRASSMNSANSR